MSYNQLKKIRSLRTKVRCMYGHLRLKLYAWFTSTIRIVIGASGIHYKGWFSTEMEYLNLIKEEHWKRAFGENSIDAILAEHVWEHLTFQEGLLAARNCYRYLKPGGYLRVAVPDGYHPDSGYIENVKELGTGHGANDHKILFNYKTFEKLFRAVGFNVRLLEYFDSDHNFHFENWDPGLGIVQRSKRFDKRNKSGKLNYTSIIIDAKKEV